MILLYPVLLLLFLVLGVWFAHKGGQWAYKKYRHIFAYIGGFFLILILVFGDEVFGHFYWQHLCETEGGIHVYKKVPVEGFLYKNGILNNVALDLLNSKFGYGYGYIEGFDEKGYDYKSHTGHLHRFTLNDKGQLIHVPVNKLQSRFIYTKNKIKHPHFIWGYDSVIRDIQTKELIGVQHEFGYQGSLVIKFIRHITGAEFEGSADYCGYTTLGTDVIKETIPAIQSIKGVGHE